MCDLVTIKSMELLFNEKGVTTMKVVVMYGLVPINTVELFLKLVSRRVALNHWIGLSCSESCRTRNLSSKSLSQSRFETWLMQKHPNTTKPCTICPFASQNKQWINALIYSSEQCSSIRYELQLHYL